ncbi:MAG: ATP-binding protein [Paludibacter sp.]|nr:ATP-binding protein [Paludibacter sp.]
MNPFSYGTIVRGDFFFDRVEECERIVSTLSNGNNLVLFAPRRYGKTSLVFRVIEKLEEQGFICVYFDFSTVYSLETFVNGYIHAIEKKQSNLQKLVQAISMFVKNVRPKLSFDSLGNSEFGIELSETNVSIDTAAQALDLPEKMTQGTKHTIVIFDEFQDIIKLKQYNFENLLRSSIQQQTKVKYLFLGSKTHLLNEMFNNKNRAFYNSASHMQLGTLPQADTVIFLQRKFVDSGIKINTDTALFLIEQSGDIPYYIQLLAAEIWQFMINSQTLVTNEIVSYCTSRIVELKQDYYHELFDRQSVMQKQLLKALVVSGNNVFSAEYSKRFRLTAASTIQKAILVLLDNGIIDKTENSYFISDPFFRRYIQNYA